MAKKYIVETIQNWYKVESKSDFSMLKSVLLSKNKDLYIAYVGYGNLGDEVLLTAHQKLFPKLSVENGRISRPVQQIIRKLNRKVPVRVGILGGGTLIDQTLGWLTPVNYLLDHDVPMFCFGTGVADHDFWVKHPTSRTTGHVDKWVKSLKKFEYVGVRGPLSQAKLAKYGLKAEIIGDAAFSMAPNSYKQKKKSKKIGINFGFGQSDSMWGDSVKVEKQMVETIKRLISFGYNVDILPIWEEDLESNRRVLQEVNNPNCTIKECYDTYESYTEQLSKYDVFIGQKLHSTIFATTYRIPAIMLEYRPKCRDFMASIDAEEFNIRTDQINVNKLIEKVEKLYNNSDKYREVLDEKVLYYKRLQIKRANEIQQKILNLTTTKS